MVFKAKKYWERRYQNARKEDVFSVEKNGMYMLWIYKGNSILKQYFSPHLTPFPILFLFLIFITIKAISFEVYKFWWLKPFSIRKSRTRIYLTLVLEKGDPLWHIPLTLVLEKSSFDVTHKTNYLHFIQNFSVCLGEF